MTEVEMVGWHHQLDGHKFVQAPGVGDGQESLVCCSPWGHKESDTTERQNNNMLWVQRRLVEMDIDQEKTKSEWKSLSHV